MIDSGKVTAEDLKNPFGGNLSLARSSSDGHKSFWVDSADANLPPETCVDILTTDWGASVNSVQVHNNSNSRIGTYSSLPIELNTAVNVCKNRNTRIQLRYK